MKNHGIRKAAAIIALLAILTGCGESSSEQNESSSSAAETSSVEEAEEATETEPPTAATETETSATDETAASSEAYKISPVTTEKSTPEAPETPETTEEMHAPELTEDDIKNQLREYTFVVVPSGVEVCFHGHVAKHIEMDCSALIQYAEENSTDPSDFVKVEDFNFDGYIDFFVPETFDLPERTGRYFHYDSGNGFVDWDELNSIGGELNVDDQAEVLTEMILTDPSEWECRTYGWEGDNIRLIEKEVRYKNDEGEIIHETYEGGTLIRRQKIITGVNEKDILGSEDLPLD